MSNKTIAKLFEEAGDMAIAQIASMRDLQIKNIQADEIHSFVAARGHNVERMLRDDPDAGTTWAFLAVCAESKLIFSYRVGDRTGEEAIAFIEDVASKLRRAPDGSFATRPQLNTDGLRAYHEAIDQAFGLDADHGVLRKNYEKVLRGGKEVDGKYIGADRISRLGKPRAEDIHTSFIERQNLNLRQQNRRFTRRTNAFSKTLKNHERHLALWILYHNFCWLPYPNPTEVIEDGKLKTIWVKRDTAAMVAGLTDKLWEIEDILALTDAYTSAVRPRKVRKDKLLRIPPKPIEADPTLAPFWVYQPFKASKTCKVHAASCCNCRGGMGRNVNASGKDGSWFGFQTREEAEAEANLLKPGRVETCRMCLGERRKMAGINT